MLDNVSPAARLAIGGLLGAAGGFLTGRSLVLGAALGAGGAAAATVIARAMNDDDEATDLALVDPAAAAGLAGGFGGATGGIAGADPLTAASALGPQLTSGALAQSLGTQKKKMPQGAGLYDPRIRGRAAPGTGLPATFGPI